LGACGTRRKTHTEANPQEMNPHCEHCYAEGFKTATLLPANTKERQRLIEILPTILQNFEQNHDVQQIIDLINQDD
jgi:hypothetical protein